MSLINFNSDSISFILIILAITVLLLWIFILNKKIQLLLAGGIGKDLPEAIGELSKRVTALQSFEADTISFLKDLNRRVRKSPQGISLVRFNAFKDGGTGGQSFALSVLDEDGNGVVVSSIYGRGHVGVYSKPISKFTSTFELTDEEKEAINESKKKLGTKA